MKEFGLSNFLFSFIGIFVAMDIIGTLPIYLSITRGADESRRKKVVRQSIFVAATVAFIFSFLGRWIFRFLGVAMYDFKVGGGIVLLVMAVLDLIRGKESSDHAHSTGVVPLAVPLISGPALITATLLQVPIYGHFVVVLALSANFLFAYLALKNSSIISKTIGHEGTDIVSKIAALLMTAIAFSMIRSGIFDAIRAAGPFSMLGALKKM